MAQRSTGAGSKGPRRKTSGGGRGKGGPRIAGLELPASLGEYGRQVRRRLDSLEKDVSRARAEASRRATRLLREASHRLGRLEVRGESGWRELTDRSRRELASLLRRLERAVEPGGRPGPSRRKTAKGAASRKATAAGRSRRSAEPGAPPGPGAGPASPPGRPPGDGGAPPA